MITQSYEWLYTLERESDRAKERDVQRKEEEEEEEGGRWRDERLAEGYKWLMSGIKRSSLI